MKIPIFTFERRRAFTLIELLVVITIFVLLAGIILVILRNTRNQARDSRIITNMNQIRSAAEIALTSEGSYSKINCSDNTYRVQDLCNDIQAQGKSVTIQQNFNSSAYCARVDLYSGKIYCVDSTLVSKAYPANATSVCQGPSDVTCN
jgi:prepilin-type N-terminal cleavage/methylation domain-containing protein